MDARTLHALTRERPLDHSDKHNEDGDGGTYNDRCRGEKDFRIQGLPHSTVHEHDHIRKKTVQKMIHQFEKASE